MKRLAAGASAAADAPATGDWNIRAGEKPCATVEAELGAPMLGDVAAELERVRLIGLLEAAGSVGEHDQRGGADSLRGLEILAELAPGVQPSDAGHSAGRGSV